MRKPYPDTVEEGRIRRGYYASNPHDRHGAFLLYHPAAIIINVLACEDIEGWDHVSVSLLTRSPTWDEMCWVKALFWGDDEWVMQFHPASAEAVNDHPHCLHLWRPTRGAFPHPPKQCV
jgi:hypothetical protein